MLICDPTAKCNIYTILLIIYQVTKLKYWELSLPMDHVVHIRPWIKTVTLDFHE